MFYGARQKASDSSVLFVYINLRKFVKAIFIEIKILSLEINMPLHASFAYSVLSGQ